LLNFLPNKASPKTGYMSFTICFSSQDTVEMLEIHYLIITVISLVLKTWIMIVILRIVLNCIQVRTCT